jgi:hypothetical protein
MPCSPVAALPGIISQKIVPWDSRFIVDQKSAMEWEKWAVAAYFNLSYILLEGLGKCIENLLSG